MDAACSDLLAEVRAFRQRNPEVRYVDLISLDIPGFINTTVPALIP